MIYWCLAGEQVSSWYARELWISNRWAKYQRSMSHRAIPNFPPLPNSACNPIVLDMAYNAIEFWSLWEPNKEREQGSFSQVLGSKQDRIRSRAFWYIVCLSFALFAMCRTFVRPMLGGFPEKFGQSFVGNSFTTARKSLLSTNREPPVCTSFPTGTAPPVLSARALSTGQLAWY